MNPLYPLKYNPNLIFNCYFFFIAYAFNLALTEDCELSPG
jgi:hypothetical protein